MAPKMAPVAIRKLREQIEVLNRDRDQWKRKAEKLDLFVRAVANKAEQSAEVKKIFISVRRLWIGSRSLAVQTKPTKLGKLPRLSATQVVVCGDVPVPPPPPQQSPSDGEGVMGDSSSSAMGSDSPDS